MGRFALLLASTSLAVLIAGGTVLAAAGELDPAFGNNGKVTTSVASGPDKLYDLAVLPSGKIVAAGTSGGGPDFVVARFLSDGSLDDSFGEGDGITTTNLAGGAARALLVQPDGKLLVAGVGDLGNSGGFGDIAVVRYRPDGSLDKSFGGGDGKVITDLGERNYDEAWALAMQGEKIVVGGYSSSRDDTGEGESDFALVRYLSDGTLDKGFGSGGDGVVRTDLRADDFAYDLAVQENGKLVAAGAAYAGDYRFSSGNFALVRYLSSGAPDTTFGGGDGEVVTDLGGDDDGSGLVLRGAASPVVAGSSASGKYGLSKFALAAYNSDGSLDETFGGGDGKVRTDFNSEDAFGDAHAYDLAIQPDGKLVAAGVYGGNFAMVRYLPSGGPDKDFGEGGRVTNILSRNGYDVATVVVIQPDSKVLAGGWAGTRFALARYQAE